MQRNLLLHAMSSSWDVGPAHPNPKHYSIARTHVKHRLLGCPPRPRPVFSRVLTRAWVMVALLDLPDELLELIVDRLMRIVGTVNGTYRRAYVHPSLPTRPFGCDELQPLRATCRRLQQVVHGCMARHLAVVLCSDRFADDKSQRVPAPAARDRHPSCPGSTDGPYSINNDQPGWRILHSANSSADCVHSLEVTLCYTSSGPGVMPEASRVARNEAQLEAVLQRSSAGLVRLGLHMHQIYYPWADENRYDDLKPIALSQPLIIPHLRHLRLDDAAFYIYLPWLILCAPDLETVLLEQHTRLRFLGEFQNAETRLGASAVDQMRLPKSRRWRSLTLRQHQQYAAIYSPFLDFLNFDVETVVLDYVTLEEQDSRWRQEQAECAGTKLLNSDFDMLVFRSQQSSTSDAGDRLIARSAIEENIRERWKARSGKRNAAIQWETSL